MRLDRMSPVDSSSSDAMSLQQQQQEEEEDIPSHANNSSLEGARKLKFVSFCSS